MYGKPGDMTTHTSFSYFRSPEGPRVHIDLFIGGVEGDKYVSPSWGNKNVAVRCEYPHSGWQYVNFFGFPILAQSDAHTLFTVQYGADYMTPRGNFGYLGCYSHYYTFIRRAGHPSISTVHLLGFPSTFRSLCTVDVSDCPSPYSRELPLSRMFKSIERVAEQMKLTYTIACDTLAYVSSDRKTPPLYGAIAIPAGDSTKWLALFDSFKYTSTYVVEHPEDGSFAHLRYSRVNPCVIAIFTVPSTLVLNNITNVGHGAYSNLPLHTGSPEDMSLLENVCRSCERCPEYKDPKKISGRLRNELSNRCVERSGERIQLSGCSEKVCMSIRARQLTSSCRIQHKLWCLIRCTSRSTADACRSTIPRWVISL
jgi:hypothetical protein